MGSADRLARRGHRSRNGTVVAERGTRPEWIEAFRNARTDRSGSPEYLNAGSEPAISGQDIEWKVGPEDHLDANLRVHERVDIANGVYREVVAKRAAEGDRVAQEQRVRVAAIAEAQRKLDEANGIAP